MILADDRLGFGHRDFELFGRDFFDLGLPVSVPGFLTLEVEADPFDRVTALP